jgi:hypothetical protein
MMRHLHYQSIASGNHNPVLSGRQYRGFLGYPPHFVGIIPLTIESNRRRTAILAVPAFHHFQPGTSYLSLDAVSPISLPEDDCYHSNIVKSMFYLGVFQLNEA